ncbi:hypothetical protein JOC36_001465 [Weissella uvarum]|uniref:hypothetical protein n=1 Tax=Weissella uvarum TaxID=1479233 RepID=UPI001961D301|nr:hypothetical protein [Weissella uvarum]MBM7617872.1 hypothetical protein [Weissella uvarum]MCM0596130.1 hypothetical protein [Weissella uvarum]
MKIVEGSLAARCIQAYKGQLSEDGTKLFIVDFVRTFCQNRGNYYLDENGFGFTEDDYAIDLEYDEYNADGVKRFGISLLDSDISEIFELYFNKELDEILYMQEFERNFDILYQEVTAFPTAFHKECKFGGNDLLYTDVKFGTSLFERREWFPPKSILKGSTIADLRPGKNRLDYGNYLVLKDKVNTFANWLHSYWDEQPFLEQMKEFNVHGLGIDQDTLDIESIEKFIREKSLDKAISTGTEQDVLNMFEEFQKPGHSAAIYDEITQSFWSYLEENLIEMI